MLPLLTGASDLSSVHTGSGTKQLPIQFVLGLPDLRVNRPSVNLTIRPLPVTSFYNLHPAYTVQALNKVLHTSHCHTPED